MTVKCSACGQKAPEGTIYCSRCGARLRDEGVQGTASPATEQLGGERSSDLLQARSSLHRQLFRLRTHRGIILMALAAGLIVLVIVVVIVAARRSGQPNGSGLSTPDQALPKASVEVQRLLDVYNAQQVSLVNAFVPGYGPSRCWASFVADFPDEGLVTLIKPSGYWMQLVIDPIRGVQVNSIRDGPDYAAAGINPATLDTTGYYYPCQVAADGSISLVP
jgi:hypothetical protein